MDQPLQVIVEINEWIWSSFEDDVKDTTPEEIDWQITFRAILRHLRIEAAWHLASLERAEPMPVEFTDDLRQRVDSKPMDFERNFKELEEYFARFVEGLGAMTAAA